LALAAILGIGLGLVFLRYPDVVIRLNLVGRLPRDRRGEYGGSGSAPARWRWIVRGVGLVVLTAGAYFGAMGFSSW
jgi:hypothetical protein